MILFQHKLYYKTYLYINTSVKTQKRFTKTTDSLKVVGEGVSKGMAQQSTTAALVVYDKSFADQQQRSVDNNNTAVQNPNTTKDLKEQAYQEHLQNNENNNKKFAVNKPINPITTAVTGLTTTNKKSFSDIISSHSLITTEDVIKSFENILYLPSVSLTQQNVKKQILTTQSVLNNIKKPFKSAYGLVYVTEIKFEESFEDFRNKQNLIGLNITQIMEKELLKRQLVKKMEGIKGLESVLANHSFYVFEDKSLVITTVGYAYMKRIFPNESILTWFLDLFDFSTLRIGVSRYTSEECVVYDGKRTHLFLSLEDKNILFRIGNLTSKASGNVLFISEEQFRKFQIKMINTKEQDTKEQDAKKKHKEKEQFFIRADHLEQLDTAKVDFVLYDKEYLQGLSPETKISLKNIVEHLKEKPIKIYAENNITPKIAYDLCQLYDAEACKNKPKHPKND